MNEWHFFCSKWLIRRRQNSRWLTSSSWVRMNEFQSDWISLSQSFVQNGWIQDRRIHDGSIIKLSQNEWVKFFCPNGGNQSWQVWVSLSRYTKMAESKMAKFMMAEFKMAAIIKLSQNEWVKFIFVQSGWIQDGRIQDGCHPQVEWQWMSEVFICSKWLNPRWQNSRWLTSSSEVRMNEWRFFLFKMAD